MRHMTGTDGLDAVVSIVAETPDEIAAQKQAVQDTGRETLRNLIALTHDVPQIFGLLKSTQNEAFKNWTLKL